MSRRGWLLFGALGVIWGIPYLLIKVAVEHDIAPASLVFLRTVIGVLLLLPVAAYRGQLRPLLTRWKPILAFAVAEVAIPWLLLSNAERTLSSSLSGLLLAAVPLVGALLGWLTGTDRLGARRLLGLGIGFVGVAALVGLDTGGGNAPALLQMAGVAVGYAVGPYLLARYLSDLPGLGVIAAALLLTGVGYAVPGIAALPSSWPPASVVWSIVALGVVCTAAAFLLMFALVEEVGPVRATVITYVNPVVAIGLGVALLHEPLTLGIVVGFVLALTGSYLATDRSGERATVPLPEPATTAAGTGAAGTGAAGTVDPAGTGAAGTVDPAGTAAPPGAGGEGAPVVAAESGPAGNR